MTYWVWKKNERENWKYWNSEAERWSRQRSDEDFDVDQHFIDNYVDDNMIFTISLIKSRKYGATNPYTTLGILIDNSDWDGWTLQSASLIGDHKGSTGPSGFQHKYLTTAWTNDNNKNVYVGLHHWGSLDQNGNKIPNGTHIRGLGYFKPTDERYEGIERLFRYDFNDDQIVNGKAWKEPKFCTSCGLRKGEMINPVQTPRLGPSRPSYDELADLVQDHRLVFVSKQSANTEGLSNELTDVVTGETVGGSGVNWFPLFNDGIHPEWGNQDGYLDTVENVNGCFISKAVMTANSEPLTAFMGESKFNTNSEILTPLNIDTAFATDVYQRQELLS